MFTINCFYKLKEKTKDIYNIEVNEVCKCVDSLITPHSTFSIPYCNVLENLAGKRVYIYPDKEIHFTKSGITEEIWKRKKAVFDKGFVTPTVDKVNHPSHYTWLKEKCGIEVIDITRHMNFDLGNAIKYILRSGHKTEEGYTDKDKTIEDLKKAAWYINDYINELNRE